MNTADALTRVTGLAVVDEHRALSVIALTVALLIPPLGLPLAVWVRARARRSGSDPYLATLAVQISVFLLAIAMTVVVIGFIAAVLIPITSQ